MTWISGGLLALGGGAVIGFWGWIAVQVVGQRGKLLELEARLNAHETHCGERLEWIRAMDETLKAVHTSVAVIEAKVTGE